MSQPATDKMDDGNVTSMPRRPLTFHCQLAHGSPTGIISGFTNVKELYQALADTFEIPFGEIIFCTLNTHKIDMNRLLGGQIGLSDFIFAHTKGRPKEVELMKTDESLGLTITDNGAGYSFVKRIKEGSIVDQNPLCQVGDLIEKFNGQSMVGKRHYEVAKILREYPRDRSFTLRLVEPLRSGFAAIAAPGDRRSRGGSSTMGSGKETLRLRGTGQAVVEQLPEDVVQVAIAKIESILESFMGISDTDLAQTIWELGESQNNPSEFVSAIENSDLSDFGFNDEICFDFWGAISDAKAGRLKSNTGRRS